MPFGPFVTVTSAGSPSFGGMIAHEKEPDEGGATGHST